MATLVGALSLGVGALFLWDLAQSLQRAQSEPLRQPFDNAQDKVQDEIWRIPGVGWAGLLLYPTFPLLVRTLGSETPLYLALILGTFAFYARRRYSLTALFATLAVLTRVDGLLIPAILGVDYLFRIRGPIPWKAVLSFVGLLLPWFAFAWGYYGSPLPVTLFAKRQQGVMEISQRFAPGLWSLILAHGQSWHYVVEGVLLVVGLIYAFRWARTWLIFLAWSVVYTISYTVLGVTRYFWYYAPLVPGIVAATGLGIVLVSQANIGDAIPIIRRALRGAGLVTVLLLTIFQVSDLIRLPGFRDERYPAYRTVGDWLRVNTDPDITIGALEVGIIGYYAQRPMVDFSGLVQPEVARQFAPKTTYQDAALWAVDQYQPDFLVLHDGLFPRVEEGYTTGRCQPIQFFPGADFGYSQDLVVYDCR